MMKDDAGTTNLNWMDENNRYKNDQKVDGNYNIGAVENEFLRTEHYYTTDNIPMIPQPSVYFGAYDYRPQIFFENAFANNDRDAMPPYPDYHFEPNDIIGNGQIENNLRIPPQDLNYMGYLTHGIIPSSMDSYQNMIMTHHYPAPYVSQSNKMIKQEQPYFYQKEEDQPFHSFQPYSAQQSEHQGDNVQLKEKPEPQRRLMIGGITREQRRKKIMLYLEKKKKRTYQKKVSYTCRKQVADLRVRVKGRFVSKKEASMIQGEAEKDEGDQYDPTKGKSSKDSKIQAIKIQQ